MNLPNVCTFWSYITQRSARTPDEKMSSILSVRYYIYTHYSNVKLALKKWHDCRIYKIIYIYNDTPRSLFLTRCLKSLIMSAFFPPSIQLKLYDETVDFPSTLDSPREHPLVR